MSGSANLAGVVPASLSFLAIYNPSLSKSEDSLNEQIVYYYDQRNDGRKGAKSRNGMDGEESKTETNEKLRHVGLAQGMVQFAAGFSDGAPVDSVETEKSRIVVHKIEDDWWLLASVALTRLPRAPENKQSARQPSSEDNFEYSAREISSPVLLIQQIVRAHNIFLLHHGISLSNIWDSVPRDKFCGFLERFWDSFLKGWDVMLHANPAVDVYNGIKLSSGGELGIGVGEEEWGSGEREVLEGFIGRTEGLVDLIVSRFEQTSRQAETKVAFERGNMEHHGTGHHSQPSDGVIFSGVGSLTRSSIRNVAAWNEWLAMYGSNTYGVRDNPSSNPRRRRDKEKHDQHPSQGTRSRDLGPVSHASGQPADHDHGIPAPIVPSKARIARDTNSQQHPNVNGTVKLGSSKDVHELEGSVVGTEVMKYLTLGVYGSTWGIPAGRPAYQQTSNPRDEGLNIHRGRGESPNGRPASDGLFLIGLLGNLEDETAVEDHDQNGDFRMKDATKMNNRILVRSLFVERTKRTYRNQTKVDMDPTPRSNTYHDRLRVLVYVQQPFIFTFLFEPHTDSLALSSLYRSLHHQLGPLQRPLSKSTDPSKVTQRLWDAASTKSTTSTRNVQPIRDLVYDPARLTIHTTIPNIPEPGLVIADNSSSWTRVEALGVHAQILNIHASTRRDTSELERTCKTSRAWWVVWMRLPPPIDSVAEQGLSYREAYLIRRSSDTIAQKPRKSSSGLGFNWGGGGADDNAASGSPQKLAEGIGIDARQYIEGLLSLNR